MPLRFPAALRTTRATTILTLAGNAAIIRIYSGTQPATPETAPAVGNTLLAEFSCQTPFGTVSNGVLTAGTSSGNVGVDAVANATGTAVWFRLLQSNGTTPVMDGTVTGLAGNGELKINSTSIQSGASVSVSSLVISESGT